MIKEIKGRFEDYSISLKIRHILLHWAYELKNRCKNREKKMHIKSVLKK